MAGQIQRILHLLLLSFLSLDASVLNATKMPPPPPPSSPPPSPPPPPYQYTEYEYIVGYLEAFNFANTTLKYLKKTCLDVALGFTNRTTFLAPTNAAWRNLKNIPNGKALRKKLRSKNKATVLFNLLLYHMIPQYKTASDFQATTDKTIIPTYLGAPLYFSPYEALNFFFSNYTFPSNNVSAPYFDILMDSVISIQGIDGVLIPADLDALDTPRPGLVPCPTQISPPPLSPPLSPPPPSPPPPPYQYTEYEYIVGSLEAFTLANTTLKYLKKTCLDVALGFTNRTTFLAPTNAAWRNLKNIPNGKALRKKLWSKNKATVLFNLLLYHMIPQYKTAYDFQVTTDKTILPTYLGAPLYCSTYKALNFFFSNYTFPSNNVSAPYFDIWTDTVISIQGVDGVLIPADLDALDTPRPGLVPCPTQISPPPSPPPPSSPPTLPPPPPYQYTEYEYIVGSLEFFTSANTTIKYLNETCLDVALSFTNRTTLLAPVNDAWDSLKDSTQGKKLLKLLEGEDRLTVLFNLILYHMIPQYKTASDFQGTTDKTVLPTYLGAPLYFSPYEALNVFYANYTDPSINSTGLYADILDDSVISIQGLTGVLIPTDMDSLLTPRPGYVPCPAHVIKPSPPPPSPSVTTKERKTLLILTTIFSADVLLVE